MPAGSAASRPDTVRAGGRTLLIVGAVVAAVAAVPYLVALATHPMNAMLKGFDLQVYLGGADEALHHSHSLYNWTTKPIPASSSPTPRSPRWSSRPGSRCRSRR